MNRAAATLIATTTTLNATPRGAASFVNASPNTYAPLQSIPTHATAPATFAAMKLGQGIRCEDTGHTAQHWNEARDEHDFAAVP